MVRRFWSGCRDARCTSRRRRIRGASCSRRLARRGRRWRSCWTLVGRYVEANGINLGSAGHLGFIPPSSLYPAALGDYLATVINRYAGVYFAAPGAVQMENMVLRWMADFVGFPQAASGDLTSGGSLANMIGVVTAREAAGLRARDYERAVVYLSEQTHHSVAKALRIAGMQECVQRQIPLDAAFHMQPQALAKAIAEDRRGGAHPVADRGGGGDDGHGRGGPAGGIGGDRPA